MPLQLSAPLDPHAPVAPVVATRAVEKITRGAGPIADPFGLRALSGEAAGYAHASELSEDAIRRAAQTVRAVHTGHAGTIAAPPPGTNRLLYTDANPLSQIEFGEKAKLLAR